MTETVLPTQYQQFIHKARYARWLPDQGRRESWQETVDRYIGWIFRDLDVEERFVEDARQAILRCDVMPSMRALMTAGEAADQNNISVYNCAYTPIDKPLRLSEILLILMHGTGVGFSVERRETEKLPVVPVLTEAVDPIHVEDSRGGWADAYRHLIDSLYSGVIRKFDVSDVRPHGTPLKTFGGRASGPEPLLDLWQFTVDTFEHARLRRLKPIELHDIVCMIGHIVVCGGVRRSALISLSDFDDSDMRDAKSGNWWEHAPQRAMANNSAVYEAGISEVSFMREWQALAASGSGERGIFSRTACDRIAETHGREPCDNFGTNPCSEIILRPQQFCNLSEPVVRPDDTYATLEDKVGIAALLGTAQATKTDFRGLSPEWQQVTEHERLLGVSMTGIMDNQETTQAHPSFLMDLRDAAIGTNAVWAERFGINPAGAVTCVKPSGTVSQLVDAASGLHPRYADYYIRRVRGDKADPMSQFLVESGVPYAEDVMNEHNWVFDFPVKAPEGCLTTEDVGPISHLEMWLDYQSYWADHKPSVTISIPAGQWFEVGAWVWSHLDSMSGVSFLPWNEHTYQQAPYEEITEEDYLGLARLMPSLSWEVLDHLENTDNTTGAQELACSGGSCEIQSI